MSVHPHQECECGQPARRGYENCEVCHEAFAKVLKQMQEAHETPQRGRRPARTGMRLNTTAIAMLSMKL